MTLEEKEIRIQNDLRLAGEVGLYHATAALERYNECVNNYRLEDASETREDHLINMLKEVIPHLAECRKLNYSDDRLKKMMSRIQLILNGNTSDLEPIRL